MYKSELFPELEGKCVGCLKNKARADNPYCAETCPAITEKVYPGKRERELFMTLVVTINGLPGKIVGRLLEYPRVVSQDGTLEGEWNWWSARSVVSKGGGFVVGNWKPEVKKGKR